MVKEQKPGLSRYHVSVEEFGQERVESGAYAVSWQVLLGSELMKVFLKCPCAFRSGPRT